MIMENDEKKFDRIIKHAVPYLILSPLDDKERREFMDVLKYLSIAYINQNKNDFDFYYNGVVDKLDKIEKKYMDKDEHMLDELENTIFKKYDEEFFKRYERDIRYKKTVKKKVNK